MVTFTCLRSGNQISLTSPDDISALRKHEGYKERINESQTQNNAGGRSEGQATEDPKRYANEENGSEAQGQNVLIRRGRGRPRSN